MTGAPRSDEASKRAFISYSRSESVLVDELADRLNHAGVDTWIDYLHLVPGSSWSDQIDRGIDESDVIVVVVSPRAVESSHVVNEFDRGIAAGKRVILAIAEPTPLPSHLDECEWVDVRTRFHSATRWLADAIVTGTAMQTGRPPESGFRAPLRVWLTFLVSIVAAIGSLLAVWTVVLPVILVSLPARILRRASFAYTDVRNALLALPLASLFSLRALRRRNPGSDDLAFVLAVILLVVTLAALSTWLLLRSGACRRWCKPSAARPLRRSKALSAGDSLVYQRSPEPLRYRIDVAPEDEAYAQRIESRLAKFGHERTQEHDSGLALRIVSRFSDTSPMGMGAKTLPIIISEPDRIAEDLARTQWIDLRRGLDRSALKAIGHLLDRPEALLRRIGSPPPHNQRVLPRGVGGIYLSLWVGIFAVAGYLALGIVSLRSEVFDLDPLRAFARVALVALLAVGMSRLISSIRNRQPCRSPATQLFVFAIGIWLVAYGPFDPLEDPLLSEQAVDGSMFNDLQATVPSFLLFYFWVFRSTALRRWIPARGRRTTNR